MHFVLFFSVLCVFIWVKSMFSSGIMVCWSSVLFLKEKNMYVCLCMCMCVRIHALHNYKFWNSKGYFTCKLNAYKTNDEMKQIWSDVATGRTQWWWIRHAEIHEIRISTEALCIVKTNTESNLYNFIMESSLFSICYLLLVCNVSIVFRTVERWYV